MNTNLRKYQNIHSGERVFIIGNGPSLRDTNLDLIKNEYSFAMNRISLIYSKTEWRPSFYVFCSVSINDKDQGDNWKANIREVIQEEHTLSFIWDCFRNRIGSVNNYVEWFNTMSENGVGSGRTFYSDIVKSIDKFGTTMNVALQIASYMGFKKIFIVGADLGWEVIQCESDDDPNHFDPSYKVNITNGAWEAAQMRKVHLDTYEAMKKLGIQVYNASHKTLLDVYPLVDYETIVKDPNW